MKKLGLPILLILSACSTKETASFREDAPKTYVRTEMAALPLLLHTEQYLEWTKGYSISIRDQSRGLLVTDWVYDSPGEKHQVTIRVNPDVKGSSMLSAHTNFQRFEGRNWKELPSDYRYDAELVQEISQHLNSLQSASSP